MFRAEFLRLVMNTGMMTLKEIKPLATDKNPGIVSEVELLSDSRFDHIKFAEAMAKKYNLRFQSLENASIQEDILGLFKKNLVVKYRVVPIQRTQSGIIVATYDPSIIDSLGDLKNIVKTNIEPVLTDLKSWVSLFSRVTKSVDELMFEIEEMGVEQEKEVRISVDDIGEDVINIVNRILAESYMRKASDIHIEPYEKDFRVRLREDGRLIEIMHPPTNLMLPIISRVKIMAKMDIAERRRPQDGRIKLMISGRAIDYRVSSLPTLFGEKIVLRLLDSSNLNLDMEKLGFETKQLEDFKSAILLPYGMCLVTGPTGSGKTTTLYSALSTLNDTDRNISTAEDPVEFNIEGINQVNIRKDIEFTFAKALRSFLRQDPDIIMVGEIRDLETCEMAVEAALTGHLVLSTLHTNDAPSTISRLLNMGIEPFLIVGALNVVVAQRLCRRICPKCKVPDANVSIDILERVGLSRASAEKIKVFRGQGCSNCNGTGYKGRVAIYEVLRITNEIRDFILQGRSADDIKRLAIQKGMKTLRMTALTKVAQGQTTLEEAIANSAGD